MANATQALKKVRELCLSLPDTREGAHFDKRMFYVQGKGFATCGEKNGVCEIVVQLEPEHASTLVERDARFKRYPMAKHCVSLDVATAKSWDEVKGLLLESYELAKPKKARPARKKPRTAR
jgi:predicted DNA-binding protein (MmcQ/YjbR family)